MHEGYRKAGARARGALVVVGLASLAACTLLLNAETKQCTSDADCDAYGADLTCVASSCVPKTASDADARTDADLDDADVEDREACSTNEECVTRFFGEPVICSKPERRCVELKRSNTCSYVIGSDDVKNDNVVVFGAFLPLQGAAPLSQPLALAYQLALEELRKAGGIPGGTGAPRRPLAAVLCDSDPARVELGVKHLVQTVRTPAMIALFSQTDMTRFVQDYTVPNGVFTLNPQDTTEALKNADVNRLVWHLLGTPQDVARAYKPLVARMETYVRKRPGIDGRDLRVALVTSKSPTEEAIEVVVRHKDDGVEVNGRSASDNEANGALLRVSVPSLDVDPGATFGPAVAQIAAHRPDLVILLTGAESGPIVTALEPLLAADGGAAALPVYALATRNAREVTFLEYLASNVNEPTLEKRRRFFGIQYAGAAESAPKTEFLARMRDAYPQVDQATYSATENFYDAIYWLAYGLYAAGPGAPVTGDSFKEGVRKLLTGPRVSPGAVSDISDAFLAISTSGAGVTFVGALGPPDIDPARGTWRSVGAVYCYPTIGPVTPSYDVLRYNPTTKALDGDFSCFIGF